MYKILIIIVTLFCSCSEKNSSDQQDFEKINFNVNANLISIPIVLDDSFTMSFPNIVFKNSDAFNTLNNHLKKDNNSYFPFRLIDLFSNDNILIYIGQIEQANLFSKLNSNYIEALKETYNVESINMGKFNINGVNVVQYMFNNEKSFTIKLYINILDKFYEITYILNASIYEDSLKYIESSIGSVKSIQKRGKE